MADHVTPEDAALLAEAEWLDRQLRTTHGEGFAVNAIKAAGMLSGLITSLRAALAREAELVKTHNREYADLLKHSVGEELRAEAAERDRDALQWDIDRLKEELRQATRDAAKWQSSAFQRLADLRAEFDARIDSKERDILAAQGKPAPAT